MSCHIARLQVLEGRWTTIRLASRGVKTRQKQEKDVILLEKGVIRLYPYKVRVKRTFLSKQAKQRYFEKKGSFFEISRQIVNSEALEGAAGTLSRPPI